MEGQQAGEGLSLTSTDGPASQFLDAGPPSARATSFAAFAHRGFAPDGAENSMLAFARAVELGYRYLETDARVSADGVAIALHDDVLDRVSDRRGVVSALPWREVRRARIAGTEPVPRLDDVLGTWPGVRVNIDLKSDAAVGPALHAIRRTRSEHRVCLASFDEHRLVRARAVLGPGVCTAVGPQSTLRLRLAAGRARPVWRVVVGDCVQVPHALGPVSLIDRPFVAAVHSRGLPVHVWTVNDADRMRRLLDLGVDGIFTDRADVLRDVLIERGRWT